VFVGICEKEKLLCCSGKSALWLARVTRLFDEGKVADVEGSVCGSALSLRISLVGGKR